MHRRTSLIALLTTTCLLAGPASVLAADGPASGPCVSPHNAIYSLLFYLQDNENRNPAYAAMCIDRTGLERPASQTPELAIRLKSVLDARGLYVNVDELPTAADYKNDGEQHAYTLFPTELPDMTWVKTESGRWLLKPEARDRIDKLYTDSFPFNMDDFVSSLPEWARSRILGVSAWQLVALFLLMLAAVIIRHLIILLFRRYLKRLLRRVDTDWIKDAIASADGPIGALAVAGVIAVGFPLLQFPAYINKVVVLASRTLAAFSVVWLGYRFVDVIASVLAKRATTTDSKLDDQLVPLIRKSLKLFLAIIGLIFILQNLQVDVGSLLAGLGIGGLAFALAAKDTVANLFGSLMIFIDKPFQIGDWIIVGNSVEGSVEEVGFRTTRIRTFYNSLITMPNAVLTNSAVDNMGMRRYRRYKASLGLAYDTPPEKVQAFCEGVRAIIQSTEGMRQDFYLVEFHSFGNSELNILVYCFMDVPDWDTELRARTAMNLNVLRVAQSLGVQFAFPTQTLHVASMPPTEPDRVPTDTEKLAEIVDQYAVDGPRALPYGFKISPGYKPGAGPQKGSHEETDEDAP